MGIGTGIFLAVLGLILLTGVVQVDIPFVNEYTLGIILILGGITAITLSLTLWRDRRYDDGPTTRVVERREVRDVPTSRVVEREVRDDPDYL